MFSEKDTCVKVMQNLFEQIVQNNKVFKNKKEGLYFLLKIDGENRGYEKNGNTNHKDWRARKIVYLHILLIWPHNVFIAVSDSSDMPEHEEFENTSNHDSCWRSDGFTEVLKVTYEIYDEIYKNTPKEHTPIPLMANIDYSLSHAWIGFGEVFKVVKVDMQYVHPRYHLTSLEVIKKEVTL